MNAEFSEFSLNSKGAQNRGERQVGQNRAVLPWASGGHIMPPADACTELLGLWCDHLLSAIT